MNRGIVMLGASFAIAAALLGGCGADDTASTATATRTATAAATTRASASATTSQAATSLATVSDPATYTAYVAQVCPAAKTFKADLASAASDVRSDPTHAASIAQKPFDTFAASMRNATPPPELQAWQDALQARLDDSVKALKSGDLSALANSVSDQLPAVPDGARARLQAAAKDNQDCHDAGLFG